MASALDEQKKKKFPAVTTREVGTPQLSRQGRGGAVRLQRRGGGADDLLLGVKYWAIRLQRNRRRSASTRRYAVGPVRTWTGPPTRTAATWMMDTNVKQGVKKGGYGLEEAQSGDTVGDACPEVGRVNGDLQREWMKQQQMMVTNMHTKPEDQDGCILQRWHEGEGGATFQQWDGGRTRLDYGIILKDRLKRVTTRDVFTLSPLLRSRVGAVRLQRRGGGGYDLLLGGMGWATDKANRRRAASTRCFADGPARLRTGYQQDQQLSG